MERGRASRCQAAVPGLRRSRPTRHESRCSHSTPLRLRGKKLARRESGLTEAKARF